MMNDEIKMAVRKLRDLDGQTSGMIAACNAVLGHTASKETRLRVMRALQIVGL